VGAREIFDAVRVAVDGGNGTVTLAGGSTPLPVYRVLAASYVDALDWQSVDFFLGDERAVPADDERSNRRAIGEALAPLLARARLHGVAAELGAVEAAAHYDGRIRRFFGDRVPRFDLSILGVGQDGHTASLFPGCPQSDRSRAELVVATRSPSPPRDRISVGYRVLCEASRTVFLVRGRAKAAIVAETLTGAADCPASRVSSRAPDPVWVLDPPAASRLPMHLREARCID
jgi:6-phosphogluconolactonase